MLSYFFPQCNPLQYAALSIFISGITAFLSFFFFPVGLFGIAAALFLFAGCLLFLLRLPGIMFSASITKMESELPLFLRTLSLLLEMRVSFPHALHLLTREPGEFGKRLSLLLRQVDQGASFQKTFASFAAFSNSLVLKRALAQIQSAYAIGGGAHELRQLAYELLSIQRFTLREYASRLALIGLLFIAVSTILPTFFIVVAGLGDALLETSLSGTDVPLIFLGVFPLLSLLVVLIARAMSPRLIFRREEQFNFLPLAALGASVMSLSLGPPLNIAALSVLLTAMAVLFINDYRRHKLVDEVERHVPDALMVAAALPPGSKLEQVFREWKASNLGRLSDEGSICLTQLTAHVKPETVLFDLQSRYDSPILRQACRFLELAINTRTLDRLSEVAEDILAFREVDRERLSLLSMQRYTVLFASVLTPLIIKSSLALVGSLGSLAETSRPADFSALVPPYILIFAALTSYFISEVESARKNATVYFLASLLLGAGTFYFITL